MRIIFITNTLDVDDLEVGYLHRWVEELAKNAKSIEVICVKQGYYQLPPNVKVRSLGWEKKKGLIHRTLKWLWHITATVWHSDAVFIHGSPWYVFGGAPLWLMFRKPIGIWYEEGKVGALLGAVLPLVSYVFTPTSEGFHAGGDKKRIVGHGVDMERFAPLARPKHDGIFRIVTGGHISRAKDYATLIRATALVDESIDSPFKVSIVGAPKSPNENEYAEEMRTLVRSYGLGERIIFLGPMKNAEVVKLYRDADLFVSVYTAGRVEKSLAEATGTALPVLTSNRAFEAFAGEYDSFVFFKEGDDVMLAERIRHVMTMSHEARRTLGLAFRRIAERDHGIDALAKGIVKAYRNG